MDADNAAREVRQLVRDLLSRNPTVFNSAINAHFASACTYKGRGVEIHGVSQIKHAAWLVNFIDSGSAVQIPEEKIFWDQETLTAVVQTSRNVRPIFFPFLQLSLPTKIELTFNGDVDSGMLFCTRVLDDWPVIGAVETLPIVGRWYRSVLVPLLSAAVLFVANMAFFLHSVMYSYSGSVYSSVNPKRSTQWLPGFQSSLDLAEKASQRCSHLAYSVAHGPLHVVERVALTGTHVCNLALPQKLQLPYPRIFTETGHASTEQSVESTPHLDSDTTFVSSPGEKKETLLQSDLSKSEQTQPGVETPQNSSEESKEEATVPKEAVRKPLPEPESQEPAHAQVVIGSPQDGSSFHREIDVVTKEVTHVAHDDSGKLGPSLFDEVKQDGRVPSSNSAKPQASATASRGPPSQSGSVSRKKSGKRKPKPAPPRQFNLSKPSNDTPSPTSPKSAKGGNY